MAPWCRRPAVKAERSNTHTTGGEPLAHRAKGGGFPWVSGGFMDLISLVVVLIVIGVLLWLVNSMIPMDAKIKTIINVVVLIAVVLWLLNVFVGIPRIPVNRVR